MSCNNASFASPDDCEFKFLLTLTTKSLTGNSAIQCLNNSRIRRLAKFRVTDFGIILLLTTMPSLGVSCSLSMMWILNHLFDKALVLNARSNSLRCRIRWLGGNIKRVNWIRYATARRTRPFALRAAITALPPLVFMRTKKPCVRFLLMTDGWYVRFIMIGPVVSFRKPAITLLRTSYVKNIF